jgi:hypothetical protein
VSCTNNADCTALDPSCPGANCGDCAIVERRECFLDPIVATGSTAVPDKPVFVSTFCIPPTSNAAINASRGYAGAGRMVVQTDGLMLCPSTSAVEYEPGSGF